MEKRLRYDFEFLFLRAYPRKFHRVARNLLRKYGSRARECKKETLLSFLPSARGVARHDRGLDRPRNILFSGLNRFKPPRLSTSSWHTSGFPCRCTQFVFISYRRAHNFILLNERKSGLMSWREFVGGLNARPAFEFSRRRPANFVPRNCSVQILRDRRTAALRRPGLSTTRGRRAGCLLDGRSAPVLTAVLRSGAAL